jgi:hypothetical protein
MPNISWVSRSCQLAPAYDGIQVGIVSDSGTSALMVTATWRFRSVTRANSWKRVSPPV